MADMPKRVEKTVTRIEWIIGDEYAEKAVARTLTDGIYFAQEEMEKGMGIEVSDDMFYWRGGVGASIIIWVEVEEIKKKKAN